jgi:hypothetical protein
MKNIWQNKTSYTKNLWQAPQSSGLAGGFSSLKLSKAG